MGPTGESIWEKLCEIIILCESTVRGQEIVFLLYSRQNSHSCYLMIAVSEMTRSPEPGLYNLSVTRPSHASCPTRELLGVRAQRMIDVKQ